jgi:ATP-dependent helicase HrpB
VTLASLPIDDVLPQVVAALRESNRVVLSAPAGAGKTTRVPGAIFDALAKVSPGGVGQVVMLEPRRLAAQSAAARIAQQRGTPLGAEVGYHVRFERRASRETRILVVTDGIFVRRLQDDPFLEGVSAVVFDEFHERSLQTDLSLAMVERIRREIRPDLAVAVMSATLDVETIAAHLQDAPIVTSAGRAFPVTISYAGHTPRQQLWEGVVKAVRDTLDAAPTTRGDILVFLPGVGEIRRVEKLLTPLADRAGCVVLSLYGEMTLAAQQQVLAPRPQRRIILATNVAETSITIDGVTTVIDSGLARVMRIDPALGINRLELARISQASAEQRAGRAGRTAPGRCLRMWAMREQHALAPRDVPEIGRVDLSATVLDLLCWGEADPRALPWLEPPSGESLDQAMVLLEALGAVADGAPTARGKALARLPVHPRLGAIVLAGAERAVAPRAALAAAMLAERDPLRRERTADGPRSRGGAFGIARSPATAQPASDSDVLDRVLALEHYLSRDDASTASAVAAVDAQPIDRRTAQIIARGARQLLGELGGKETSQTKKVDEDESLLQAIAAGFPDRIARRREIGSRRGVMVGGRGVRLDDASRATIGELFACVELQELGQSESVVRAASRVDAAWLDPRLVSQQIDIDFDAAAERIVARRRTRYRDLVIAEASVPLPAEVDAAQLLAKAAIERIDLRTLIDDEAAQYIARVGSLRQWMPELGLPALDEPAQLAAAIRAALPALCRGSTSLAQVRKRALLPHLRHHVAECVTDPASLAAIDRFAPVRWHAPSGSDINIVYEAGKAPTIAVRIQELFGLAQTPRFANGRVTATLQLLGPNYRPQQITSDLASFWKNAYPQVRKELRRRYPKHAWPDDPLVATPERRPGRRGPS